MNKNERPCIEAGNPFVCWAVNRYYRSRTAKGAFARDLARDDKFPKRADHGVMLRYMERVGITDEAMDAFAELWREYSGE